MLGQSTMDNIVLSTLSACLSPNLAIRTAAEQRGRDLASQHPEYGLYLTQIATSPAFPDPERQLAAVSLKQYVDFQWQNKGVDGLLGPEPPAEVKARIRDAILQGICDPSRRMRVLNAYVIARIAHFDWPEAWPNLFDAIMTMLRSGSPQNVHGAMRVLAEFVRDDLTDQHFPHIAPALLPELHRIFSDTNAYGFRDRSRALAVFRDFTATMFMVSEAHPEVVANYLLPVLPIWMDAFKHVLSNPDTPSEALPIKHEVLRTLCKLIKQFPKASSPYISQFLEPIWNHLVYFQHRYLLELVNPPEDFEATADVDSDGETLGFESLLYSLLEYMLLVSRRREFKLMFTTVVEGSKNRKAGAFLTQLVEVCLTYFQISAELEESWTTDMNQFIQDDEEEAMNFNVRIAVEELLMELSDKYPNEVLQALSQAVGTKLQEANTSRESGDRNWWKVHEACLLALGRSSGSLIESLRSGTFSFDMEGLFTHVVLADMQCNDCPYLQGRALWFASQFAEVLPPALISQYLGAAVQALSPAVSNPAVKVSAVKAIRGFCCTLESADLVPFQTGMIEGIMGLSEAASDEALGLLLETLELIAKINDEVTARYADVMANLLLQVWVRTAEDYVLSEIVIDVFTVLAANKLMVARFQERMVPAVRDVLTEENVHTMSAAVATAFTFMTALIRHAPEPFPAVYTTTVFPQMIKLLLKVEDHSILQNGQDTIKELVERDLPGLTRWTDGTKTGLDYIIALVSRLLQPDHSESAAIFVGDLISKIIQKAGSDLGPLLPDLLTAVVRRLQVAATSSFIQQLVMIFAHLFMTQTEETVNFLAALDLPGGESALQLVLRSWCDQFSDFQGFVSIKVSAIAMSKLLDTADPRLDAVRVQGDEIVTSNKPTRYTQVPFPSKGIKLLILELQQQTEGALRGRRDDDDENDDEDEGESWEEDDDDEEADDRDDEGWHDVAKGDAFLTHMLGHGDEEMEDDRTDAKNDPVFHINLK
ncbi:Importin 9, partial [Thoreauomyces humboldtii]